MILTELLFDFYSTQREFMESNQYYLISSILIALVVYFFSVKSTLLSLYPLVFAFTRYIGILYLENDLVKYIMSSWTKCIITSYIITYTTIYLTRIFLSIVLSLGFLHLMDKYNEYLDYSFYNWILLVLIGTTFYCVKKLQSLFSVMIASFYSTLVLLNSIEILTRYNLSMKNLEIEGIMCTIFLAVLSVFIQTKLHKKVNK